MSELEPTPTIVTLGPERSDHERAAKFFVNLLGMTDTARIELVDDLAEDGLERVRTDPEAILIQCSAHHQNNVVNMLRHDEVVMMAAFMLPTKEMGLLIRNEVEEPVSMGLMPATIPYLDRDRWPTIAYFTHEQSKPVVAQNLLAGQYDAGITTVEFAAENPDVLRVGESFGKVNTAWLAYRNVDGIVLPGLADIPGISTPELFLGNQDMAQ